MICTLTPAPLATYVGNHMQVLRKHLAPTLCRCFTIPYTPMSLALFLLYAPSVCKAQCCQQQIVAGPKNDNAICPGKRCHMPCKTFNQKNSWITCPPWTPYHSRSSPRFLDLSAHSPRLLLPAEAFLEKVHHRPFVLHLPRHRPDIIR